MNTDDVAKLLYQTWATRMDVVSPQKQTIETFSYVGDSKTTTLDRDKARSKWHALEPQVQSVWLDVAEIVLSKFELKPVLRLNYDDGEVE